MCTQVLAAIKGKFPRTLIKERYVDNNRHLSKSIVVSVPAYYIDMLLKRRREKESER